MAKRRSKSGEGQPLPRQRGALSVLLVDHEPQVRRLVAECLASPDICLLQAATLAEARKVIAKRRLDLALIEPNLADGSGLALADELRRERPATQTIVMSGQPSLERAIEAVRAGAADIILKPLDLDEVSDRVRAALARQRAGRQKERRIERLRRICKKLHQARSEVAQQVDILCNDLVTAYQELATQVQQVAQTQEFAALVRHELDLESLLRRTLEYLLQQGGPTNAAIFLPSSADEFSLGGYVNYDCTSESADVLLQHLADVVAPKLAGHEGVLHLTDNEKLTAWIGDDAAYLADSHVLAFPASRKGEALAIVVLFRDGSQPFSDTLRETCAAIAPLLADYLARIIRIHHRHHGVPLDEAGDAA